MHPHEKIAELICFYTAMGFRCSYMLTYYYTVKNDALYLVDTSTSKVLFFECKKYIEIHDSPMGFYLGNIIVVAKHNHIHTSHTAFHKNHTVAPLIFPFQEVRSFCSRQHGGSNMSKKIVHSSCVRLICAGTECMISSATGRSYHLERENESWYCAVKHSHIHPSGKRHRFVSCNH